MTGHFRTILLFFSFAITVQAGLFPITKAPAAFLLSFITVYAFQFAAAAAPATICIDITAEHLRISGVAGYKYILVAVFVLVGNVFSDLSLSITIHTGLAPPAATYIAIALPASATGSAFSFACTIADIAFTFKKTTGITDKQETQEGQQHFQR